MKKAFKIISAIILVAAICSGAASTVFAAEEMPATIEWKDMLGDDFRFYYGGSALHEGLNELDYMDAPLPDDLSIGDIIELSRELCNTYYEFEVEKTGYYKLTVEGTASVGFAKEFDGTTATGIVDCVSYGDTIENMEKGVYQSVYHLEEGLTVAAVMYYIVDTDAYINKVTIDFLGEKVTDYTVDEATLDDFLIGMNIWEEDGGEFGLSTTGTVTFSSGEVLEMAELYIPGTCDSELKEGKNKATVELFGIEKEIEFTAYYLEKLIKSVEIDNVEEYTTCSIAYDGTKKYADIQGEEITFKFADGTEYTATVNDNMATVVLPNGMSVDAFAGISYNGGGELCFMVSVLDTVFAEYSIVEKENSFIENAGALAEDNLEALYGAGDSFVAGIINIFGHPDFSLTCFGLIFEELSKLFVNFAAFIGYYI